MTAKELQQRNEKADHLRVLQTDDGQYFVESGEGKILYKVNIDDNGDTCTCGDFSRGSKKSSDFKCKHILAVFNAVPNRKVEGVSFLEKQVPKLDPRWIAKIEGKEFVKYPGLLDLAHQHGLSSIEVDIVQMPTKDNGNFAVCRATVMSKIGETFIDIGDCGPHNCSSKVAKHLLRMASTRAIARSLRSYVNVGMTALEELADFNDVISENTKSAKPKTKPKAAKKPAAKAPKKTPVKTSKSDVTDTTEQKPAAKSKKESSQTKQPKRSEAQYRAICNLSRRRGISMEEVERMAEDSYGVELDNLSSNDAAFFIRNLQMAS